MRAGIAIADITPPLGALKIGSVDGVRAWKALDPLHAKAAVFENGTAGIGFVQLDTLSVRWTETDRIRKGVQRAFGFPGEQVMVFGTHNHAGPAVANAGRNRRDDSYLDVMVTAAVAAFGRALESMKKCSVGVGQTELAGLAFNRRIVMRDGTARTNGTLMTQDALGVEGPVDEDLSVLAVRSGAGDLMGALVNFSCHPVHLGHEPVFSAGYPGVLAREMARRGCPATLFANGAAANVTGRDPRTGRCSTMKDLGVGLAARACSVIRKMSFRESVPLICSATNVSLNFRKITPDEVAGTTFGAQRLGDPVSYDETIPALLDRIRDRKNQPAEIMVSVVGDFAFCGMPCELFSEHGLRIKESSATRSAKIVGYANGMVGYVPTLDAFRRGGYETTFAPWSRMAPETGDVVAGAAIGILEQVGVAG